MSLPQEPREPLLEALRRVDAPAWRRQVRAVLLAYGDIDLSARALGVASDTLERWLREDPELRDQCPAEH